MGMIREPAPVKLFVGILVSEVAIRSGLESRLVEHFGPIDLRSEDFAFDLTHYYDEEMGTPIKRAFLSFEELINPSQITEIKRTTNMLEETLAAGQQRVKRPANLDPGYIEEAKVILASTKNFYHRIYLKDGIYGEVTLHFRSGRWESFPWSFPDFRSSRYDAFFASMRVRYREQLKAGGRAKK